MPRRLTYAPGAERTVRGGRLLSLTFDAAGEHVPAALLLPDRTAPAPAVLLLHGFTSSKERMLDSAGRALLDRGVASLGIDLPLHGERERRLDEESLRNPLDLVRRWRAALAECRAAIQLLAEHPAIDAARLALIGYSLGAYLGVIVGAREPVVRAVVLAAGGDLPANTPFSRLVRTVADPIRAVRGLAGRPLLMVHGRTDRTVRPDQAERLFAAAAEPKTIAWYDGGHWIPQREVDRAAEWLARTLEETDKETATGARKSAGPGLGE